MKKRQLFEIVLMMAGTILLCRASWNIYQYWSFQRLHLAHYFTNPLHSSKPSQSTIDEPIVIGRISIPRLKMSEIMVEGDDGNSLSIAAGHMKGTALVGSQGNVVIAGHRDTVFWPLRNIKKGDRILVSTDKDYVYFVEQTQVVDPTATRVLQETNKAVLTLVTCYPFRHVGPSPKRFIVIAKLLCSEK